MIAFDTAIEKMSRTLARRSSKRSFLSKFSAVLTGAATLPLLPVARGHAAGPVGETKDGLNEFGLVPSSTGNPQDPGDPTSCSYWRYCAIDGFLCSCCGGTASSCPPGAEMSPITWIGTCQNPADTRNYIISYNDCCGRSSCGRCFCNTNQGDRPVVRPQKNNDINWCLGTEYAVYKCSTGILLGVAFDG
ncbi:MAG: methylamine dehydrogenase light chain [Sphingomonadales bacterium]